MRGFDILLHVDDRWGVVLIDFYIIMTGGACFVCLERCVFNKIFSWFQFYINVVELFTTKWQYIFINLELLKLLFILQKCTLKNNGDLKLSLWLVSTLSYRNRTITRLDPIKFRNEININVIAELVIIVIHVHGIHVRQW